MIEVREIKVEADVDALVFLGRKHLAEAYQDLPFDPVHVAQQAFYVIDLPTRLRNAWVAWQGKEPIGYAVGAVNQQFFAPILGANLQLVYILPTQRGGWGYKRLISAYEEWAREMKATQVFIGVSRLQEDEADRICDFFPRLGYKWSGLNYIKEIGNELHG